MTSDFLPRPRLLWTGAAIFCAALLGYAYFSQFVLGYEPCPLCVVQRIAVFGAGVAFALAAIHHPRRIGQRVYGIVGAVFAGFGAGVAARHVWLQNLPEDRIPDCGPGIEYMFEVFPFMEAVRMVFQGSGECAEVDWTLLGISMPGWVLVICVGLFFFSLWNGFRHDSRP